MMAVGRTSYVKEMGPNLGFRQCLDFFETLNLNPEDPSSSLDRRVILKNIIRILKYDICIYMYCHWEWRSHV